MRRERRFKSTSIFSSRACFLRSANAIPSGSQLARTPANPDTAEPVAAEKSNDDDEETTASSAPNLFSALPPVAATALSPSTNAIPTGRQLPRTPANPDAEEPVAPEKMPKGEYLVSGEKVRVVGQKEAADTKADATETVGNATETMTDADETMADPTETVVDSATDATLLEEGMEPLVRAYLKVI